ncbi:MAG: hypothetical protein AAB669_02380 [Patescibacteria group bacterium]
MRINKFAISIGVTALVLVSISLVIIAGSTFKAQETDTGLILTNTPTTSVPFYDHLTQMGIREESQRNFTLDLLTYSSELNAGGQTHILMNNIFAALMPVWQTTEFQTALEVNDMDTITRLADPALNPYRVEIDRIFGRIQLLLDRNQVSADFNRRHFSFHLPGVGRVEAKTILCEDQRPLPKPFDKILPGWCLGGHQNGSPWDGGDSIIGPGGRPIIKWGDNAYGKPGVAIQPGGGNWGISGTIVPSLKPQGRDLIKPNIDIGGGSGGIWIAPGDGGRGIIIGGTVRF